MHENFKIIEDTVGNTFTEYMVMPEDIAKFFMWEHRKPLAKFSKFIFAKYFEWD